MFWVISRSTFFFIFASRRRQLKSSFTLTLVSAYFRTLNFCDAFHKTRKESFCMLRHITMYDGAGLIPCLMKLTRGKSCIALLKCWSSDCVAFRICNTSGFMIIFIESQLPTKMNVDVSSKQSCLFGCLKPTSKALSRGWQTRSETNSKKVYRILVHLKWEIQRQDLSQSSFFSRKHFFFFVLFWEVLGTESRLIA